MHDVIRLLRASRLCLGTGLILLALWGQSIAPLAALRMAAAAADPLALSTICGHSEASRTVEDQTPASTACRACPLCAVGLSSPILPESPAAAERQRWHGIAWPIPPPTSPARPYRHAGQPRAPPIAS